MKNPVLLTLALVIVLFSSAQSSTTHLESVVKFSMPTQSCIQIPSSFAKRNVNNQLNLPATGGKKITQIDLVYTRYKTNPKFDQVKLNEARIQQLKQNYPQLVTDNPRWNWIEQTGATTAEEGKTFFHGFVIHFDEPAPFHDLKAFMNDQGNLPTTIVVDNEKGGDFVQSSGSILHVPAHCVQFKSGAPVVGSYTLAYTEYRNAAEIAFSGIPMTFSEKQVDYQFNSMGMYELRGSKNGEDLALSKPIRVDFNCTEVAENVSFFELNDENGIWKEKQPIVFGNDLQSTVHNTEDKLVNMNQVKPIRGNATIETTHGPSRSLSTFSESAWDYYLELKKSDPKFIEVAVINEDAEKRQVEVWKESASALTQKTMDLQPQLSFNQPLLKNDPRSTLLASGSTDPGHSYPSLVRGLNSPTFGVYNCDQIFRVGEQISLNPTYIDQATGKAIAGAKVACVINLNLNGSFSFDPRTISFNPKAANVILLFTANKSIYAITDEQLKAMNSLSGNVTFEMTNISSTVKTSDDLKVYLGL